MGKNKWDTKQLSEKYQVDKLIMGIDLANEGLCADGVGDCADYPGEEAEDDREQFSFDEDSDD